MEARLLLLKELKITEEEIKEDLEFNPPTDLEKELKTLEFWRNFDEKEFNKKIMDSFRTIDKTRPYRIYKKWIPTKD
jgi:hypothetical protein